MPLARDVVRDLAVEHGGCIRPVQLRRTDLHTGQVEQVLVPCGHTLATVCPSCAERAKSAARRPVPRRLAPGHRTRRSPPTSPTTCSACGSTDRAETQHERDQADAAGQDTGELDELTAELDEEITRSGVRGNVLPADQPGGTGPPGAARTPPTCPGGRSTPRTIGKTYTAPDGKTFRPSMFITLTCDSYGKVSADGTPADPAAYDYQRAARDALHFAALFDRLIQNLRRFLGYDVQYFAAVEPQRRLAPHVHVAIRGTMSRAELRQVLAATYHQVWWPPDRHASRYDDAHLPVWHEPPAATSTRPPASSCPPGTTRSTPSARMTSRCTWPGSAPSSTPRASWPDHATPTRCIGYLTKYLTKHVADCHQADTDAQHDHAERLADALRYEPCSPTCANWLRYGIQPKNPREGLRPGRCTGKAHRREYLGYAGRRVLVSRKWSGKTLADHRADRKAWLLDTLGLSATDPGPLHLGARHPRRPRPHATRPAAPARRRRPPALARRAHRSQTTSNRAAGSFGNQAGGLMASQRDELLTVAQVLAALGNVSPRTFYRWRETGKAPSAVRLPNGELRIWRSDLNAWLDRLREEPAA